MAPPLAPPRAPLLLAGLALLVAGCAAPGPAGPEPDGPGSGFAADWAAQALPFGEGHDHADPFAHAGRSTPNFEVLGWDPLATEHYGAGAGGYFCGESATTAEGRHLAVVNSFVSDVAFVLADVTDPARPVKVGEYLLPNAHVYDVAMTRDGRHVVVGTNPTTDLALPGSQRAAAAAGAAGAAVASTTTPMWRDACTGEVRAAGPEQALPLGGGVVLVGIADPTEPVFEDFFPTPLLGAHSVSTAEAGGRQLVLASVTNLAHYASGFHFLEVAETPLGPRLQELSVYQQPPDGPRAYGFNGHVDGTIQVHPVTGRTIAYLADWNAGLVILDVTEPRTPVLLASWTDHPGGLGGADSPGAIHGTLPIEGTWEGRHYTFAGQELGGRPVNRPSGWVHVFDTTDPAAPERVGAWVLPVDVTWDGFLMFSTHYFTLVERTLFVTMYHGGVWAVDVGDAAKLADPPTVGVFLPANAPPGDLGGRTGTSPEVLQALTLPGGELAVFDANSGVYTVRFDASRPAPAPPAWKV